LTVTLVVPLLAVLGCSSSPSVPAPITAVGPIHGVALNRGLLRTATLDLASGATSVEIRTANLSGKLATASTPPTSPQSPRFVLTGRVAHLQLTSSGSAGGPSLVTVDLNSSVIWTIVLDGGATEDHLDLRGGKADRVDFVGGVTSATVNLPARTGTQLVQEVGGASKLTVTVPRSVATRVTVGGGASTVKVGRITTTGVAAGQTLVDPGYATAAERLNLELTGGVSSVTVHKR
jgi:hypothetical protein